MNKLLILVQLTRDLTASIVELQTDSQGMTMSLHLNTLPLFLLGTVILLPAPYLLASYTRKRPIDPSLKTLLHYWCYFIFSLFTLRVIFGIILLFTGIELYGIAKFYPIRIAYPNYELLHGLPYAIVCILIGWKLKAIKDYFLKNPFKYGLVWGFAVLFLLCFGAIHGGFIAGNEGIAASSYHRYDATLNPTLSDLFATHVDRITDKITPAYQAPHSSSHPAISLAYWQIMTHHATPLLFSVVNVLFLSLVFPAFYWALRKRFGHIHALQSTLACLFIPALLIYGRSDDVIHYSLTALSAALLSVGILEKRFILTLSAAVFLACAMNFSYATLILFPALFAFNSSAPVKKLIAYIRSILPHGCIFIIIMIASALLEMHLTHFNWLDGFKASVHHNVGSNIVAMFSRGDYARIINDRVMAICDFLIFAGPLIFYLFVSLIRKRTKNIGAWQIKNLGLVSLFLILAINSNGPGEVSRPWGSLFLLIGFFWLPNLLQQESEKTRWRLIQAQLAWALLLQILLHFGW